MPESARSDKPDNEVTVMPAGQLESEGSDTDPPSKTKVGGLGEGRPGPAKTGGTDTGGKDGSKTGLGED